MLSEIRKNIKTSNCYSVLFFVFLLFLLNTGQDLLHNHEPDLIDHDDCPAHQLYLLFSSTLLFDHLFCFILLLFVTLNFIYCQLKYSFFHINYNSHAPPFQILINCSLRKLQNRMLILQNLKGIKPCIQVLEGGVRRYSSPFY